MKSIHNITTILITITLALLLSACNITDTHTDILQEDTTPPVITLNGEANITLEQDAVYTELGATALDGVDGNVSVTISGTVDTSKVGTYIIAYSAKDKVGNEANATRSVEVITVMPILSSLSLESNTTTANKGETVQLSVVGTYSDNSTKAVNENVTYIITPADKAKVNDSILTALKDGNVTVQATVGGVVSNSVKLHITWVVNGHVLPPEPDPTVNNATLLGVDSNDNGVRDDVERWIYETYDHPIERGIFMQSARAYNKVIVDPSKAHETMKYIVNVSHCESYWSMGILRMQKRNLNYTFGEYRSGEDEIGPIQFNTMKRHMAYTRFNGELSGGVYGDKLEPDEWIQGCEFDEKGILKELK
ncbi:Bacillolysin (Neutral protease) [hydrothermal vent metagenome]|uniref:Bacillolysin (Neutral protease) n=1 Tax=hydrothermal vent metagenome TaxID=652676 RepID=A0A1W1BNT1_9ZZZZ